MNFGIISVIGLMSENKTIENCGIIVYFFEALECGKLLGLFLRPRSYENALFSFILD